MSKDHEGPAPAGTDHPLCFSAESDPPAGTAANSSLTHPSVSTNTKTNAVRSAASRDNLPRKRESLANSAASQHKTMSRSSSVGSEDLNFGTTPVFELDDIKGGAVLGHSEVSEFNEAYSMFVSEDVPGISAKDLIQILTSLGHEANEKDLHDVLCSVDQSGNGIITFAEFMVLMGRKVDHAALEEMTQAFRYFDKDGTGFVTRNQFREMLELHGERSSSDEVEEMLAEADPLSIGQIDYRKFLHNIASRCM